MDLIESLESYNIRFKKSGKPDEIWLCCPWCGDNRFRLGVNVVEGKMHCFNDDCDIRSNDASYTFRMLEDKLSIMAVEAAKTSKPMEAPKPKLPEDFRLLWPKSELDHWGRLAYRYVRRRGLTQHQIRKNKIGYSLSGAYAYRVIFPIYVKHKLVGFVGRDFTDQSTTPYKNAVGDKSLFNLKAMHDRGDTLVLSEGLFDCYAIEHGCQLLNQRKDVRLMYDSCAVLGHNLTDRQLKQLRSYRTIILWPDPDKGGVDGFCKMAYQLLDAKHRVYMVVPSGEDDKDPDDYNVSTIAEKLIAARQFTPAVESKLKTWLAFKED